MSSKMINNNNNKKASIYTQVHLNTNKKNEDFKLFLILSQKFI